MTLRSNYADGNENVEKTIGFILSRTTTLHVHHAFCTFLCKFLHDYDAFYGLRIKTSIDEILFLFLNLGMVPGNSIPGGLATFDKVSGQKKVTFSLPSSR